MADTQQVMQDRVDAALKKMAGEAKGHKLIPPKYIPQPYYPTYTGEPKPAVPQKPIDQQTYQELVQGPLDQWRQGDYFSKPTNVNGDKLPYGATGWDYNSQPYYGDGITGWLNGLISKLTAPTDANPLDKPWYATKDIPNTPALGGLASLSQNQQDLIKQNLNKDANTPDTTTGTLTVPDIPNTKIGAAIGKASSAVGAVLESGLQLAQQSAVKTEQALSVAAAPADIMNLKQIQSGKPIVLSGGEVVPVGSPNYQKWADYFKNVTTGYNNADQWLGKGGVIDDAYQAGRILYSSVLDSGLRQEYMKRYNAGENPYLLAQELENPVAEAVGQLVLDPLNVIGFATRAVRDAGRIASAEDLYLKLPKTFEDGVQAMKSAATDEQAVKYLGDLAQFQIKKSAAVAQGLDDFSKQLGLSALTSTGKQSVVSRTTGTVMQAILANMNQNDALEHLRGLYLLSSKNADEVAQGLSVVRHSPVPRVMLSKAGDELGVVLRKIIGDNPEDLDKFLNAVKKAGTLDEQVALAEGKLNGALKEMFPDITARIKAGEKLDFATRAVAGFDKVMQSKVFRPVNSFFAGVYMGLSPGFAFRNFATNSLHIAVDEGISALFHSPARALEETKAWLGGVVPKAVGGYGQASGGADVARYATKLPFTSLSNKFEEWGSVQVAYASVKRTMRKMLVPGRAFLD